MRFRTILAASLLILATGSSIVFAQTTRYWDANGTAPGATFVAGVADGNWGVDPFWNSDPTGGDGGGSGTITAWTAGDHAVFSAGNDVGTIGGIIDGAFITITGTQVAASVLIEEGYTAFRSGDVNTPQTTIQTGARLDIDSRLRFNSAAGKITLQGGELLNSNLGHAGSFINSTQTIEIDGSGILGYYDTVARTVTDCQCTIYSVGAGQGIKGVGGTSTNGTGTLTKVGAGEIRVQGADLANFSFQKLYVDEGLYRIGSTGTPVVNGDRGFGASPPALLTDAITLDGGEIGLSVSLTLDANRGITITSNGGTFNNGGAGVMTVPGPVTGSGALRVFGNLLSPTSLNSGVSTGGTTLSSVDNVSTFTGAVIVDSSTLTLNESLNATDFSGGVIVVPQHGALTQAITTIGTVSIAANKTFMVGSGNANTSYAGRVTGAGTFHKIGTGTLQLDAGQSDHDPGSTVAEFSGQWTNTGGVIIDGGAIKFGTLLAGFGTTTPVTVNNGATLDMNNINDTFGSLLSTAGNTTGQVLQGTAELTLAASAGPNSYEGTITGTGIFRKGRALPGGATDTATQILSGNNSLGPVEVNAGSLLFNGTSTTGLVTVNGGTLGGTGSVSGAVTVNSGGHVAPGASIESLGVGGLTLESGSILDFELGAPGTSDLIVAAGTTTINGGTLNLSDAGGLGAGTYTLIDYAGTLGGNVSNLSFGTTPAGFSYSLVDTGSLINLSVVAPGLPGDFNEDDKVDAADYVIWRKNETANVALPNDNGLATQAERFDLWRANFGNMTMPGGGSGGAVPEPATLVMLIVGMAAVALGRRRS
jgi:hypothetical protein